MVNKPDYNGSSNGVGDTKDLFSMDSPPLAGSSPRPKSPSPSPFRSPVKKERVKKEEPEGQVQIIDHLPTAWDEAHATFTSLERCVYERKDMGLSREQDEMMVCDCVYDKREWEGGLWLQGGVLLERPNGGVAPRMMLMSPDDPDAKPCGAHSDCINRAIFIECLADECRAKNQCQNQRYVGSSNTASRRISRSTGWTLCDIRILTPLAQVYQASICASRDCTNGNEGVWPESGGQYPIVGQFSTQFPRSHN